MAVWRQQAQRSILWLLILGIAPLWALLGSSSFAVLKPQVAAHRVRTDEGLALPTNAGRRNFAVNRISEEISASDDEILLAAELREAAKNADWREAQRVLSIYDGSNTKVLTAGMQAALRCKKYQDGAEIFEQLKTREAALDVPAYTVAMKIYGKLQDTEQVDEIWRTLQDLDVVDQVACGARIDAAAELGDLEKALELVSFMKKERLGIDVLHFSSAINACAKSLHPERADHALQLFNELVSRGLKPNIITYTNFLLASRDLPSRDLLFILDSMARKGVRANSIFVENFMFVFLRKSRGQGRSWKNLSNIQMELADFDMEILEKALELIEEFRNDGIRLRTSTMNIEKALLALRASSPSEPAVLNA